MKKKCRSNWSLLALKTKNMTCWSHNFQGKKAVVMSFESAASQMMLTPEFGDLDSTGEKSHGKSCQPKSSDQCKTFFDNAFISDHFCKKWPKLGQSFQPKSTDQCKTLFNKAFISDHFCEKKLKLVFLLCCSRTCTCFFVT